MKLHDVARSLTFGPSPVNDRVGNIQLSRMTGAGIGLDPSGFDIGVRKS
jgi:1-aminocyclopropane-1-carboxylate deaminase